MNDTIKEEIEKIVKTYTPSGGQRAELLFRIELELLVLMAEREQMKEDYGVTEKIIRGATK